MVRHKEFQILNFEIFMKNDHIYGFYIFSSNLAYISSIFEIPFSGGWYESTLSENMQFGWFCLKKVPTNLRFRQKF